MTKLRRSNSDSVIGGVCGGIGEHLDIDPVIVRVAYLLLTCSSIGFPGLLIYLIMWIIVPKDKEE